MPGVGEIKLAQEILVGYNLVTGKKLTSEERIIKLDTMPGEMLLMLIFHWMKYNVSFMPNDICREAIT